MKKVIIGLLVFLPLYVIAMDRYTSSDDELPFISSSRSLTQAGTSGGASLEMPDVADDDRDEVAALLSDNVSIDSIMNTYFSIDTLTDEQQNEIKALLEIFSKDDRKRLMGKLPIFRGEAGQDQAVAALLAIANEMKLQTQQAQSSSAQAREVHKFNVRYARLGAVTGALGFIISLSLNIWQATNSTEC